MLSLSGVRILSIGNDDFCDACLSFSYIFKYICFEVCVCLCVCVWVKSRRGRLTGMFFTVFLFVSVYLRRALDGN